MTTLREAVMKGSLAALALMLSASSAFSQSILSGIVTDSAGAPVVGAQVSITGVPYRAVTDVAGAFHMNGVPAGGVQISVRRLGFTPMVMPVTVPSGISAVEGVVVKLLHIPAALPTVTVRKDRMNYTGRLAGYYQRLEKKNGGYFITREQIDRENPRNLDQLLQHVAGIKGSRMRGGGAGVRMRGRDCAPLVWLDGTPTPAGELDLSAISPQTIHGIELYSGATTAPTAFLLNRTKNSCGTIVLWSRGPDTDPVTNFKQPVDLAKLVAALAVYTVEQVDSKAEPVSDSVTVAYPQPLFAAAVGGSVTAEYIVDAAGRVEAETFGIVSSTDPLFSMAVREAVEKTRFRPAQLKGKSVRQLVQQPFNFIAPRSR